tara:strand:+ start:17562 stop:17876 length:315 start_codon:yes stop_codon:yes gene_type:complete
VNLIIDADLTNPPSEISVFRDITLYSKVFLNMDILLECDSEDKDIYYYWLKNRGAFDYVDDFINCEQERGLTIRSSRATITIKYLRVEELNKVIYLLKKNTLYL